MHVCLHVQYVACTHNLQFGVFLLSYRQQYTPARFEYGP